KLTMAERVGLLGDLSALVRAGTVPAGQGLAALPAFNPSSHLDLVREAEGLLRSVRTSMLPDGMRPQFVKLVDRLFAAKAHRLGLAPKKGEPEEAQELRTLLVPLVAIDGQDAKLQADARKLADQWLADHASVASDEATDVLVIAAAHGDRALFDRLLA